MFRAITNVPHVPRSRAFLDARALIRNPVSIFEKYRRQLGPTFTFHLGGAKPVIVTTDPGFVQHVLQKNWGNYHMSDIRVKRMAEFQGHGLLNSHGEAWLRKRRFLGQGFQPSRLAELFPVQEKVLEDSLAEFDNECARGSLDMYRVMVGFTFRLVGKSIFGSRLTDAEIEQLGSAITTIQAFMVRQVVQPYKIPWFRISGQTRRYQQVRAAGDQIARAYISGRPQMSGAEGGDLLELMLETPWEESGETMSKEQVLIECMQLLVAGNETSPVALSWTLYLLARYPRFISEMREEISSAFGDGRITFAGLARLHLTLQVLNEGMRLFPSFWMIDRVALEDDEIDGVHIPAGLTVVPYIYGMHRNPDVWHDPESFDPSRFGDEARKDRNPFAFIPFGGGPRKCIGSNMGMMQMLLILATFVRRYDFELVKNAEVEIDPMFILRPKTAIGMRVRRRA